MSLCPAGYRVFSFILEPYHIRFFLTTSINSVINTVVENELNLCDLYLLSK